jgi:hypothetical protein
MGFNRDSPPGKFAPLHRDLAGGIVIRAHRRRAGEIAEALSAVVGPSIRVLCQRKRAVPRRRVAGGHDSGLHAPPPRTTRRLPVRGLLHAAAASILVDTGARISGCPDGSPTAGPHGIRAGGHVGAGCPALFSATCLGSTRRSPFGPTEPEQLLLAPAGWGQKVLLLPWPDASLQCQ